MSINMVKKTSACVVILSIIITVLLLSPQPARAQPATILVAGDLTAPNETKNVGQMFNATIMVEGISFLYSYQIMLSFNPSIINCTDVTIPFDNVFAGLNTVALPLTINNTAGYAFFGTTLLADDYANVTGVGKICNFEFKSIAVGDSQLDLTTVHTYNTVLLDKNLDEIPIAAINGSVHVVPEFNTSTLCLMLFLSTIAVLVVKKALPKRTRITSCHIV